jgi:hypothetical protein
MDGTESPRFIDNDDNSQDSDGDDYNDPRCWVFTSKSSPPIDPPTQKGVWDSTLTNDFATIFDALQDTFKICRDNEILKQLNERDHNGRLTPKARQSRLNTPIAIWSKLERVPRQLEDPIAAATDLWPQAPKCHTTSSATYWTPTTPVYSSGSNWFSNRQADKQVKRYPGIDRMFN